MTISWDGAKVSFVVEDDTSATRLDDDTLVSAIDAVLSGETVSTTNVNKNGGTGKFDAEINFTSEPDAGEKTSVEGVIAAHDGTPGPDFSNSEPVFIPIDQFKDGDDPPTTKGVKDIGTGKKVDVYQFKSSKTEDVNITKEIPEGSRDYSYIKFQVVGIITESTAPASGEGVVFEAAGCASDEAETFDKSLCSYVQSKIADLYAYGADAQYKRFVTPWSEPVLITDYDENKTMQLNKRRKHDDTDDDYEQDVGVVGINVMFG